MDIFDNFRVKMFNVIYIYLQNNLSFFKFFYGKRNNCVWNSFKLNIQTKHLIRFYPGHKTSNTYQQSALPSLVTKILFFTLILVHF